MPPSAAKSIGFLLGSATRRTVLSAVVLAGLLSAVFGPSAHAGGGPENALLIVDPADQASMYVANYYRTARGVPEENVLYMPPANQDYQAAADFQLPALLSEIKRRQLSDHIDYILVAPVPSFFVSAEGLVGNVTGQSSEAAPRRFSLSSLYTLANQADDILAGNLRASTTNQFYGSSDAPTYLDSNNKYRAGAISTQSSAQRYFIGFQLGYTGERGNTIDELIQMIDRSVSADGTHPDGTFYYMQTDDVRSVPRDPHFAAAVQAIKDLGGKAEVIYKVDDVVQLLPRGHHDVMGVMTGHAGPGIEAADMTLLPGAWGDHLTSFAATFDVSGQEKMSRWIAKGASGTTGTVEEPYVYGSSTTGKFPHPRLFVWYLQGMSLGESLLRAQTWLPFQDLFYGDPLTQPFATAPLVDVPDAPQSPVSGLVTISPAADTELEGSSVAEVDVLVDGVRVAGGAPGSLDIRTELLPDGVHSLRVLALDDSATRNQGRWVGQLETDNAGRSVTVSSDSQRGELDTTFTIHVAASPNAREVQLWQNARVLAAAAGSEASFQVPGRALGAGIPEVYGVALYADGRPAVSRAVALGIHYSTDEPPTPSAAPQAFSYTAYVPTDSAALVDLPALGQGTIGRQITAWPLQATVVQEGGAFLLTPAATAGGSDGLDFVASTGDMESQVANVAIRYCRPVAVLRQPEDANACPGQPATFSVVAEGGDLMYRWFLDGELLATTTDPLVQVTSDRVAGTATLEVEVVSWCGNRPATVAQSRAVQVSGPGSAACRSQVVLPWLAKNR